MSTWYYTFQLSRVHTIQTRSRQSSDVDIVTFGVLVNQRDQGYGEIISPVFRDSTLKPQELVEQARTNGYGGTFKKAHMDGLWIIGPTEVRDGDNVQVIVTGTNTNDSQLPTADQQKMDRLELDALNIYYSWMAGQFISALGLSSIAEYIGSQVGGAGGAIAAFFADPVGTILGYEPQGPCNGPGVGGDPDTDKIGLASRDLESLDWAPDPVQWATGPVEMAVITKSYDDSKTHNAERCGEIARTEIDITVRRSQQWSMQKHNWQSRVRSVRQAYPGNASVKAAASLQL
jgi:hypothetical protein